MTSTAAGSVHIEGQGLEFGGGYADGPGATSPRPVSSAGPVPVRLELRDEDFSLRLSGSAPLSAAYREVTTLAVDQGRVLLVLDHGAARYVLERLGAGLGALLTVMRERRARQLLADRLVATDEIEAIEPVEFQAGADHGVGQLCYHRWGMLLLPLDERLAWRSFRRADIAAVTADHSRGQVDIAGRTRRGRPPEPVLRLLGLGADSERHRARLAGLHEGALADAADIVTRLLPDGPLALRRRAAALLVDGHPVGRSDLADGWPALEAAVLAEPTFAASYQALRARAGAGAPAWLALAPRKPASPDHVAWFFVALPGNLLALELVSTGAHATYLFRIVARAAYAGQPPAALADDADGAVRDVSAALVDCRFLREPIYLPPARLAEPRYMRYRLAIAALPSVAAARTRFVGRLIHRDPEGWRRELDEVIAWHGSVSDEAAVWSGAAPAEDGDEAGAAGEVG